MARVLSEKESEKLRNQSAKEIAKKVAAQAKEGKSFELDPEGHSSGVIPERVWQNQPGKNIENPEEVA